VGKAVPAEIPAREIREVSITVPAGMTWLIFVNPAPDHGALIVAQDIPGRASGRLPIEIEVDASGRASVTVNTSEPGWFGNG
jgi:hypothetical protein